MSLSLAMLAVMAIVLALAQPGLALPLSAHFTSRAASLAHYFDARGDSESPSGWSDLSGDAKAGVVLAPTLAAAFFIFGALFVWSQKRKTAGLPSFPCIGRKKQRRSAAAAAKQPEMSEA